MKRLDGKRRRDFSPLKQFVTRKWHAINNHTVNGRHPHRQPKARKYFERGIEVQFTREEFFMWCLQHWTQIQQMQQNGERPSIDRINNNGHYALNNIRIVPLAVNCAQGAASVALAKTLSLNALTARYCMYCEMRLLRKERAEDQQRETEPHFRKRKFCGRSCAISYRNKTAYSRYKNHVPKI